MTYLITLSEDSKALSKAYPTIKKKVPREDNISIDSLLNTVKTALRTNVLYVTFRRYYYYLTLITITREDTVIMMTKEDVSVAIKTASITSFVATVLK